MDHRPRALSRLSPRGIRRSVSVSVILGVVAGAVILPVSIASSQPASARAREHSTTSSSTAGEPLTAGDAEAWAGAVLPRAMRENSIAGAAIAVVKDGELLMSSGFGFSDVAKEAPVDPSRTLFRVASVSKTVTWTALMQLIQSGDVDLDADINEYLDVDVDGVGGPITIRDLMTHRAGFEETSRNTLFADQNLTRSLESYITESVPARIFAPGSTPAYSNFGAALAGYIVEQVAGAEFDDYVQDRIFEPLGMDSSSFRQPLPDALAERLSLGYDTADGPPQPFEYMWDAPAGSMSSTVDDMAEFMIEHLANEKIGAGRLLDAETARLMHRTVAPEHPELDRMTLGFYEHSRNGRAVIAHGGDLTQFHSELELYLDDGVGIFLAYNSTGTGATDLREDVMRQFADRYLPATGVASVADRPVPLSLAREHGAAIAGNYLASRRAEATFVSVAKLATQTVVVANDDGSVTFDGFGGRRRFEEVSPFVWRQPGTDNIFAADGRDDDTRLIPSPVVVFDRVPFLETTFVRGGLLGVAMLVLVVGAVAVPVRSIVLRLRSSGRLMRPRAPFRGLPTLRAISSALMLGVTAAWAVQLSTVSSGVVVDGGWLLVTQLLSIVGASIAGLTVVISLIVVIRHRPSVVQVAAVLLWAIATSFILVQFVDFNLLRIDPFY